MGKGERPKDPMIPLQSVDVHVAILNGIASQDVKLVYKNTTGVHIDETKFVIPVREDQYNQNITATVGDREVTTKVKE